MRDLADMETIVLFEQPYKKVWNFKENEGKGLKELSQFGEGDHSEVRVKQVWI